MGTLSDTLWWSTVAVTVAVPDVAEVNVVVALPFWVVVSVGSTAPRSVAKCTGVPSGMWPRDDVSLPDEFLVRSAVTVTDVGWDWMVKALAGEAEMPSTSQGSASRVPGTVVDNESQPGCPGPALQPNQLFSTLMTVERGLR